MGYDIGWGSPYPTALPTGTPIHVVLTEDPGYPGYVRRYIYEGPTGSKDVNLKNAENITLTSGATIDVQHGAQYWDQTAQRGYMYPKVMSEDGVPASGLSGVAYPYDTTAQAL
jgi:hypothetical protein